MSIEKSSRRDCFQAPATATGTETERTTNGVQSHRADDNRSTRTAQRARLAERKRTEQQCRDYWRHMYGTHAEIASRGGVSWVGGVRRV